MTFRLHNRKRVCAKSLALGCGDSFLDLGCGESADLVRYASESGCPCVLAIDVDPVKLTRTRRQGSNEIHLLRASGTHLPLRDETVAKIAMTEVIEHLPRGREIQSLREIRRVLRTGGRLFLSTPNKRLIFMILDPAIAVGHRHYSPTELIARISASGLKIMEIATYGGFGEGVLTPIFYLLRMLRLCGYQMPGLMLGHVDREYELPRESGYTITADCSK